jgi:hypothetical protein
MNNQVRHVYYDKKTGKILSICTKDDSYEHGIKVPLSEVIDLLSGKSSFRDYLVGYKKMPNGKSKLGLVPNTDHAYSFKNNTFEWITETNKKTECTVTWNGKDNCWIFEIDDSVAESHNDMIAQRLVFFVTLEDDFDFLVRTIFISLEELLASKKVTVLFKTNIEKKIEKISISSKIMFKSYKLRIVNE